MEWIATEIAKVDFGDKRLNKRLGNILERLSSKPTCSIPASCSGWHETKAAYRFFDNPEVTSDVILESHKLASIERIKLENIVLLIQDSSEIDYTGHEAKSGLGVLNSPNRKGFFLHPLIAVTPERVCLGVVDCQEMIRTKLIGRNTTDYMRKPIEEKESYRWLKGYRVSNDISSCAPNTLIVNICDREGDIYEFFDESPACRDIHNKAEWIVRAAQNRSLVTEDNRSKNKLFDFMKTAPLIGDISFEMPSAKGRKSRKVTQQIRAAEVLLKAPKGKKLQNLKVRAVYCHEKNTPKGEEPINWLLLTSLQLDDSQRVLDVINWYLCRWQIEIYFKVLKSGCKIEELQLETMDRLLPCLALYMIIAWRVMYVAMLGRSCPAMSCDILFEEREWKSVYAVSYKKPPPSKPPSLNDMVRLIAKLGGHLGRKRDGYPGAQTIWIGLQRVRDFVLAWDVYHAIPDVDIYG